MTDVHDRAVERPLLNGGRDEKFAAPRWTAKSEPRAFVNLKALKVLWFNTGTLCNLACEGCYIESSPRNDRLSYLTRSEVRSFVQEALGEHHSITEIGYTGGEPFMNPDIEGMLEDTLAAGYRVLVLTNAMSPMTHHRPALLDLAAKYPGKLTLRVSLDHFTQEGHEHVRGLRSWKPTIDGLRWLSDHGFEIAAAARLFACSDEKMLRRGFADLFQQTNIRIDADDPHRLVLFPEMDGSPDVPEITEHCWSILHKNPDDVMCATSRMVLKRKGSGQPTVVSCTLLPYAKEFELGHSLSEAKRSVYLNHPHCAKFCVLGGASCSA